MRSADARAVREVAVQMVAGRRLSRSSRRAAAAKVTDKQAAAVVKLVLEREALAPSSPDAVDGLIAAYEQLRADVELRKSVPRKKRSA